MWTVDHCEIRPVPHQISCSKSQKGSCGDSCSQPKHCLALRCRMRGANTGILGSLSSEAFPHLISGRFWKYMELHGSMGSLVGSLLFKSTHPTIPCSWIPDAWQTVTKKPCHPGTHVDCFLAKAWLFCNAIASKDCHGGVGTWCQSPFTGELLKATIQRMNSMGPCLTIWDEPSLDQESKSFFHMLSLPQKPQLQPRWMNSLSNRLPHLT